MAKPASSGSPTSPVHGASASSAKMIRAALETPAIVSTRCGRRIMKRVTLALLLTLGLAQSGLPQAKVNVRRYGILAYDLSSTSTIYCTSSAQDFVPGINAIATSGSSVTTTAVSGTPFDAIAVGDWIQATGLQRQVATKASGASITVNSAWNLGTAGVGWQYLHFTCGTAASDGWMSIAGLDLAQACAEINTLNGTSVDVVWEARSDLSQTNPIQIHPGTAGSASSCGSGTHASGFCNFTAAGIGARVCIQTAGPWDAVRVGLKITGDSGVQSISTYVQGRK